MRVVSFVNDLEFEFDGNVSKNAICLGDVDNDGQNELIVGNEKGVLAIFKGEKTRPIYVMTDLGMLTAVAVGDVFNFGCNVLVAITGCGICYIYDFENIQLGDSVDTGEIQPVHVQHIPANVKDILIEDINGDGLAEMVVGLTDRVVRTYRWTNVGNIVGRKFSGKLVGQNKWELVDQVGNISCSKCPDGSASVLAAQPGGTYFALKPRAYEESDQDPFDENMAPEVLTKMSVFYHGLASAKLCNPQIDTEIVGNIKLDKIRYSSEGDGSGGSNESDDVREETITFEVPSSFGFGKSHTIDGADEAQFSTEAEDDAVCHSTFLNDLEESPKMFIGFAMATLDGTLMLVYDGRVQWQLQVDHQLFSFHALDVTQDGKEEVVACAWDGNTYIVCQNADTLRFTFPQPVSTFTAGLYGFKGKQVPSLVYVTFNGRIHLYPDITMPHIGTTTVTDVLKSEPKYHSLLDKIGVDADDKTKLREIHHYLCYGKLK